jgi:arginyl-tRNA synthetase
MHIGHIRSTIIGAALDRVLRAVGYHVISDNHLGDWGTQFGKLIVAYRTWLDEAAYRRAPIAELVRLYQRFVTEEKLHAEALGLKKPDRRAAAEGDDEEAEEEAPQAVTPLMKQAREELVKLQAGDAENLALWQDFVRVSLGEFHKTYARLGIQFDHEYGESYYHPRLASLVEELIARGLAEPSRGAIICPVAGEPAPLLVRKADGSFLYGTTDIATVEHRVKTWQPARILYVVGAPQQLHFRQVFAVAQSFLTGSAALAGGRSAPTLEHVMFGAMRFRDASGNWATGSTRLGNVPLLDEFLDMAIARAQGVAQEKNSELTDAEVSEVARIVGIGAIKYNDLCRDRIADIHFDLDKAMALDGNTAPYIQYAYARMRSIGRRAAGEGVNGAAPKISQPAERALARRLLDYGAAVEKVAETCRPHVLCEYLYELAGAVSTFYNEVPVMKAEPAERASRLGLLDLAARTLQHGLSLLGIEVPERM